MICARSDADGKAILSFSMIRNGGCSRNQARTIDSQSLRWIVQIERIWSGERNRRHIQLRSVPLANGGRWQRSALLRQCYTLRSCVQMKFRGCCCFDVLIISDSNGYGVVLCRVLIGWRAGN